MADGVLGNFMADAYRAAGGGDVSVMNRGGVRAPLDSGTVTYGELFEVAPFGNMLVRLTITGAGLRAWLEKALASRTSCAAERHRGDVRLHARAGEPDRQRGAG